MFKNINFSSRSVVPRFGGPGHGPFRGHWGTHRFLQVKSLKITNKKLTPCSNHNLATFIFIFLTKWLLGPSSQLAFSSAFIKTKTQFSPWKTQPKIKSSIIISFLAALYATYSIFRLENVSTDRADFWTEVAETSFLRFGDYMFGIYKNDIFLPFLLTLWVKYTQHFN